MPPWTRSARRSTRAELFIPWLKDKLEKRSNERDQIFTTQDMRSIEALLGKETAPASRSVKNSWRPP
jgi:hypothetical protein